MTLKSRNTNLLSIWIDQGQEQVASHYFQPILSDDVSRLLADSLQAKAGTKWALFVLISIPLATTTPFMIL